MRKFSGLSHMGSMTQDNPLLQVTLAPFPYTHGYVELDRPNRLSRICHEKKNMYLKSNVCSIFVPSAGLPVATLLDSSCSSSLLRLNCYILVWVLTFCKHITILIKPVFLRVLLFTLLTKSLSGPKFYPKFRSVLAEPGRTAAKTTH